LFFVGDHRKTKLEYRLADFRSNAWQHVRTEEALDADSIVKQARAAQDSFGFKMFKLKGGVLEGPAECDCIRALAEAFPDTGITIDPNGCWGLENAVEWLIPLKPVLTYAEDPCGAEGGRSGCKVLAEFRKATGIPTATNMVATDFPGLVKAVELQAVDVPLADCHFWTLRGAVRVSELCELWGLTWGSHSNNHFDVSLAMMTHVAAAARGRVTPIDTHWIWQIGQRLTTQPLEIRDGQIKVPASPGLGIELDWKQVEAAHDLYKRSGTDRRDDSVAIQYLHRGWKFDPKRPCLQRP
jgi:glucarate dehydratase